MSGVFLVKGPNYKLWITTQFPMLLQLFNLNLDMIPNNFANTANGDDSAKELNGNENVDLMKEIKATWEFANQNKQAITNSAESVETIQRDILTNTDDISNLRRIMMLS